MPWNRLRKPAFFNALAVIIFALSAMPAWGSTYTCGVVGDKQLYIYSGGEIGNKDYENYSYAGMTYGLMDMFEVGVCWTVGDGSDMMESPVFDAKCNFSLDDDSNTAFAIGIDNASGDIDYNGVSIPYVVYTQDFGTIRGHAGYTFERDNEALFLVLDGDVGAICLTADWAQINDGADWESSVGVYTPLEFVDEDCALYSYFTFSSDSEESDTLTVEISYTIG
jgi:hypothetical protein